MSRSASITALLVASAAAVWAIRAWHLEVRYHVLSRPHLEVTYPEDVHPKAETQAREETAQRLGAQEARDSSSAA